MADAFSSFQEIVRKLADLPALENGRSEIEELHPFDARNIHTDMALITRQLFDDGHYSQATFEAFKHIEKIVQDLSGVSETGRRLMMTAFNEKDPKIELTSLSTEGKKREQEGYKFIFSGTVMAIRNPRGHEVNYYESTDQCLDHIGLASFLLRRLNDSIPKAPI